MKIMQNWSPKAKTMFHAIINQKDNVDNTLRDYISLKLLHEYISSWVTSRGPYYYPLKNKDTLHKN